MKRIIFALCLLIAVTSCVSKKKYMVAENGRLAALSRERVLNRNLGQQKDEIAKLKQQITDLMSDTTRLGQAIRDYRKSLYSNLSEQEKLNMLLKEKMEKLAEREATINKLQAEVDAQNARLQSLLNSVKDALLGFSSDVKSGSRPEKYMSSQRFASANSGRSFCSVRFGRIFPKYRCPLNHRPMIASSSQASVIAPSGEAYSVV